MRKTRYLLVTILILFSFSAYTQQVTTPRINPFSAKIGWSLEGGATYTLADFHQEKLGAFGRTFFEYYFPTTQQGIWGIRAFTTVGILSGSGISASSRTNLNSFKTSIIQAGAGGLFLVPVSSVVVPYAFAGGAYLYFDPRDENGNPLLRNSQKAYSRNSWDIIGELGFKFLVDDNFSLNIGANVNYFPDDNLDDVVAGSDRDIFFTAFGGFSLYFGGTKDSDHDGISDDEDWCAKTPEGIMVDEHGCPLDYDGDHVPDYLDQCPGTPNGVPVDEHGCPIDNDEDGVPDYLDHCNDTPPGVAVDKRGCPLDTDKDGVPDYKDKCPDTPVGTEVDQYGCPIEMNKIDLPEKTTLSFSGNVLFEVGKFKLLEGVKSQLDDIATIMKNHPKSRWLISGYTDNTGPYELNKRLSYDRANSIAEYLESSGIDRSRFMVFGYGPDYPVADNSTESGRAMNRRVRIDYIEGNNFVNPNTESLQSAKVVTDYNDANERLVGNMIFTDGNSYVFQVASFRTKNQADELAQKLNNEGEYAFVVKAYLSDLDGTWYRVRVGFFSTVNEAKANQTRVMGSLN